MENQETGYISHPTPEKSCKNGTPTFEISLQNSPTTIRAQGFTDEQYEKLAAFRIDNSPTAGERIRPPSHDLKIKDILERGLGDNYYTINVKVRVGPKLPKIFDGNRIKEDIVVKDNSGESINLHVWNKLIEEIENGCYVITHVKLKSFKTLYLMATPYTTLTEVEENDVLINEEEMSKSSNSKSGRGYLRWNSSSVLCM